MGSTHLFVIGGDYHLGDLLWLTAVLAQYHRQMAPKRLAVAAPDRAITRILEHNPLIGSVLYGEGNSVLEEARAAFGPGLTIHDLRPLPLAIAMMRQWRYRLPWLYYRDLWLEGRGQWLATYLRLGPLADFQPVVQLSEEDRDLTRALPSRYIALAPHVGHYALPLANSVWHRVKGWDSRNWVELADRLRSKGFEPVTLAAEGQEPIAGTRPIIGLPIRQVAGVIESASALVTVESGLWFLAAALRTPYIIVPWWLPGSINWPGVMTVPHRLIYRDNASTEGVLSGLCNLIGGESAT
jgi:hypothetical protein